MNRPVITVSEAAVESSLKPFSTAGELAEHLGLSQQTLAQWRCTGDGPAYVKVGRTVRYARHAVFAWIESRSRTSTTALPVAV